MEYLTPCINVSITFRSSQTALKGPELQPSKMTIKLKVQNLPEHIRIHLIVAYETDDFTSNNFQKTLQFLSAGNIKFNLYESNCSNQYI
jgi:hypothetical protein